MAQRMDVPVGGQYSLFRGDKLSAPSHADACSVCPVRYSAICEAVDDEAVRELGAVSWYAHYQHGEPILREGEDRVYCFNVVSGTVRLYKLSSDGGVQVNGFLLPGNLMGLPTPWRVICSADAVGPTVLCCFPVAPFREILAAHPELYDRLVAELGNVITNMQAHMLWIGRKSAIARLAAFLLEFGEQSARAGGRSDRFLLPMGRGDIGNFLGMSLETISRSFTRLRHLGLIELALPERVRILDRDALGQLAD